MLSDYIFTSKYSNYKDKLNRRETYDEAIDRMMDMHSKKFQDIIPQATLDTLRTFLHDKKIIGSQRSLQFGGTAIEEKNWRIFNCTTSHCDRPRFFAEAMWLLLCGSGTGFSVSKHHISQLPPIQKSKETQIFVVGDSIEGWSDAIDVLIKGYMGLNPIPYFDYSQVRPKGAKLRHGGKAPGYQGLERSINKIRDILEKANGRQLRSIDCFDITMHLSDCVLSGGIRRSSSICLFDADDEDMIKAKVGDWYIDNAQRARANISAIILPTTTYDVYEHIFEQVHHWGEPGFVFLPHYDYCVNPCAEASMCPILITDPKGNVVENYTLDMLNSKEKYKSIGYKFQSGWQACNLTSINGAKIKSFQDFLDATIQATTLGTLQATYTKSSYLTKESQLILERENLLGVSITGIMMDASHIIMNEENQRICAKAAVDTNLEIAKLLGINQSTRITLIKPEGTSSLVLQTTSGIHPAHAPRYIRHVQSTDNDPPFVHFQKHNPQACFDSAWGVGQKVIAFPMEFPNSNYSYEMSALDLLKYSKLTQENWVHYGTARKDACEGLKHNVSITLSVGNSEWDDVKKFMWDNRNCFTGIALLSRNGDYDFEQAPFVRVFAPNEIDENDPHKEKKLYYWRLWNDLKKSIVDVDYTQMVEYENNVNFTTEVACAGGQCEVSI